ncbi:MAG: CobD/CbiB family protein [Burkholderiaceae bacterium]
MILLAIVTTLLLEQVWPLAPRNPALEALGRWAQGVARNVDAGASQHAWLAWTLAVAGPALGVAAVHAALLWLAGWPLALLWTIAVLYFNLGFRQFSHHFVAIRDALELGDEERARQLLAQWQQVDESSIARNDLVRLVLEHSVLAAHRHVFGVMLWFCLLEVLGLGPAGAVFYRQAAAVARHWPLDGSAPEAGVSAALAGAAQAAWGWIDWLPARSTALALAIVGSFEDAIDAWRRHADRFGNANDGVILAATAGAVGVRLGSMPARVPPAPPMGDVVMGAGQPDDLPGEAPSVAHFARVVGLVWRMVALWLLLLALLTAAHVLG